MSPVRWSCPATRRTRNWTRARKRRASSHRSFDQNDFGFIVSSKIHSAALSGPNYRYLAGIISVTHFTSGDFFFISKPLTKWSHQRLERFTLRRDRACIRCENVEIYIVILQRDAALKLLNVLMAL